MMRSGFLSCARAAVHRERCTRTKDDWTSCFYHQDLPPSEQKRLPSILLRNLLFTGFVWLLTLSWSRQCTLVSGQLGTCSITPTRMGGCKLLPQPTLQATI